MQHSPQSAIPISLTFLVADDDKGVRQLLASLLTGEGVTVLQAGDSREAIEIYRQQFQSIDLVLLDVELSGLDGPNTLVQLQLINPQVRFCFMTAGSTLWSVHDLLALGARQVFTKPFPSLAGLVQALRKHASNARTLFPSNN